MKKNFIAAAVLVVLGAAGVIVYFYNSRAKLGEAPSTSVHSYAECVAAGYPVLEIYPGQCTAGKITFIQPVEQVPDPAPVILDNVVANQLVQSPLEVTGTAPGTWFFEANIGLRVLDQNGQQVAVSNAMATQEWMTEQPVKFAGIITFAAPVTATGFIEIQKDNPSGLPEHDASVRIPIRFR